MKYLFAVLIFLVGLGSARAQITFPFGTTKTIVTDQMDIYEETKIPFHYSGGKVTELKWKYVYDSFPSSWVVMGCMNGTCLVDVPEQGQFENILGNPDSVGFFAYHFRFDTAGRGIIQYVVYKDSVNEANAQVVTFDITYSASSGIKNNKALSKPLIVYPNPSAGDVYIKLQSASLIRISDLNGKLVYESREKIGDSAKLPALPKGIYLISVDGQAYWEKLVIIQ